MSITIALRPAEIEKLAARCPGSVLAERLAAADRWMKIHKAPIFGLTFTADEVKEILRELLA